MGRKLNLNGKVFFRWTVIKEGNKIGDKNTWICKCECGSIKQVVVRSLMSGKSKSCGCYSAELAKNRTTHGCTRRGAKYSSEYISWSCMKQRCLNIDYPYAKDYSERGIKLCKRWQTSFELFLEDMGKKPTPKHTIERINNDGDYKPSNCRWATKKDQFRNMRRNRWIVFDGKKLIHQDWATLLNIPNTTLRGYLKKHTFEEAYNFYTNKNAGRNT